MVTPPPVGLPCRSGGETALVPTLHAAQGFPLGSRTPRPRPDIRATILQEAAIPANAAFVEAFLPEDDVLEAARRRAEEVGVAPVGAGTGAVLQLLAALLDARAVAEIGTGTGVSGLWLLRGMSEAGVLTSVDREAEHTRLARETFQQAGIAPQRTRLITGQAMEVLPRLADGGYDLVLVDGDKKEYADDLEQALRLLRPGGVVCFDNALWHGAVADPAQRDPVTVAIRGLVAAVAADERLVPALLPVGDGLLVAQKRP